MLGIRGIKLATAILILGVMSMAMGGFFIAQGIQKGKLITDAMVNQSVTYGGAEGKGLIEGIVDTPAEAQAMAAILQEHSSRMGKYSELAKDDPNRATILQALTMENSLNLAVMGYGLTQVVQGTGAFMVLIGVALGLSAMSALRSGNGTVKITQA